MPENPARGVELPTLSTVRPKWALTNGVAPRLSDRLAAAAALADRLHGRPVLAEEVDDRPMVPAFALPADTPGVSVT